MTASWVALLCKLILFLHLFYFFFSYLYLHFDTHPIHHPTSPEIKTHLSREKNNNPCTQPLKKSQPKKKQKPRHRPPHPPTNPSIASFRVPHRVDSTVAPPWCPKVLLSEWFDNNRLLDLFASMPLRGDPSETSSDKTSGLDDGIIVLSGKNIRYLCFFWKMGWLISQY